MIIDIEDYLESIGVSKSLMHYGTPRHSGRYPWGSGGNVEEGGRDKRNKDFLDYVSDLHRSGMSDTEIARGLGMTTTQLRAAKSIAKNAQKQADIAFAQRLKDKQYSNVAIGERMGLPESSVRALLAPGVKDRLDVLHSTASMLKNQVAEKTFIDVGSGVERQLGISKEKLATAIAVLQEDGYKLLNVQVDQLGTANKTVVKVLAPPGTEYRDVAANKNMIRQIQEHSEDGGRSYLGIHPPLPVSSDRVAIRYKEDGGTDADGVIYVRPGVKDVSIGNARYAQVRVAVDGTHYLKGMAIYKDDLPDGVDLMFNTNKSNTGNKMDAMKALKDDPDNPFGATIRQRVEIMPDGSQHVTSAMNIVGSPNRQGSGEEGSWDTWSRNLPSQFLSKQSSKLAKEQLDMTYENRKQDLDEIMRLTNPAVKKKLLESYADATDSAAVHLKAAALPRQSTHVILPVNSLKPTEIYAPNFQNGERVALVRFPHGGTFEIPELTVNNNHPQAKSLLGRAKDAVGINASVAEKLSGADFDGDTVLVIPNNHRKVQSTPSLKGLENFDPKASYPKYEGMKVMDARTKGFEMGDVSNLITDMTIKGASQDELARAVRHSMVVIDAEKHELNYKQSAIDNGIRSLKQKYQQRPDGTAGGASTLISKATSRTDVLARKTRSAQDGGPVDKNTGEKMYTPTGEHWVNAKGQTVYRTQRSTKLAETKDAHTLSSGTPMEKVYANHSNRLKTLANEARRAAVNTNTTPVSPSAKNAYSSEVRSLDAKLNIALKNSPRERQAQVVANAIVSAKKDANPNYTPDDLKKWKAQALTEARIRTGAKKELVDITPDEWAAIQAGAISNHKLSQILNNTDIEVVKQFATPKTQILMTPVKTQRAQSMAALGYTQAEIASALGVSLTTLKTALS